MSPQALPPPSVVRRHPTECSNGSFLLQSHEPADHNHAATPAGNGSMPSPHGRGILPALETWLLRKLLEQFGNPPLRIVLWNGAELLTSDAPPIGSVIIRNRAALWRLLRDPGFVFGDLYGDGSVEIEGNLPQCLEAIFRAMRTPHSSGVVEPLLRGLRSRPHSHTVSVSRESVHHHYDLGNDFYKLWLDERMLYSCAYFPERSLTLEQAQVAKMDHICRKLQLAAGQSVVEAGCGWGALALHMAGHYGVTVRAFNLSREQITFAREQAKFAGLTGRVEFISDDYRNIFGRYDVFVSVGMLEHVGPENYQELGSVIDRSLTAIGRGLIHSIGRNRACPMDRWTEKRIFPGAYPPSLREMMDVLEPFDFSVLDVENLRLHYARTLQHWLDRYKNVFDTVTEMFDVRFARMWRFYLASSLATFLTGDLQLYQVLFARGNDNEIPRTREYQYKKFIQ